MPALPLGGGDLTTIAAYNQYRMGHPRPEWKEVNAPSVPFCVAPAAKGSPPPFIRWGYFYARDVAAGMEAAHQLPVQGGRGIGWPPPKKEWMGTDPPGQKKGAPTPSRGAKVLSPPPHKGGSSRREPAAAQSFQDGFLACLTPDAPGFPLAPWNSLGSSVTADPFSGSRPPEFVEEQLGPLGSLKTQHSPSRAWRL